jgi:prepilin-type processing-associated H-X9-DG protein
LNGGLFTSFDKPALLDLSGSTNWSHSILLGDGCWIGTQFTSWIGPMEKGSASLRLPGRTFPDTTVNSEHTDGGANLVFCDGHIKYQKDTRILGEAKYYNGGAEDVWSLK